MDLLIHRVQNQLYLESFRNGKKILVYSPVQSLRVTWLIFVEFHAYFSRRAYYIQLAMMLPQKLLHL